MPLCRHASSRRTFLFVAAQDLPLSLRSHTLGFCASFISLLINITINCTAKIEAMSDHTTPDPHQRLDELGLVLCQCFEKIESQLDSMRDRLDKLVDRVEKIESQLNPLP